MDHKIRDGIVLVNICDEYLLIAGKSAREYCPSVMQVNETAAYIWKMLEKGMDSNEMIMSILSEFELEEDIDIYAMLNEYIEILKSNGYIVEEEMK